jgi:hypothetical protein
LPNRDFYYTAYGLTGSARATYTFSGGRMQGGGSIVDGLIADAKRDLMTEHPLQPNEVYVNWSVDRMLTETGKRSSEGQVVQRAEYRIVVSADVIRFGIPPENFTMRNTQIVPSVVPGVQVKANADAGYVGRRVAFKLRGAEMQGEIVEELSNSMGQYFRIRYVVNGKEKIVARYASEVTFLNQ